MTSNFSRQRRTAISSKSSYNAQWMRSPDTCPSTRTTSSQQPFSAGWTILPPSPRGSVSTTSWSLPCYSPSRTAWYPSVVPTDAGIRRYAVKPQWSPRYVTTVFIIHYFNADCVGACAQVRRRRLPEGENVVEQMRKLQDPIEERLPWVNQWTTVSPPLVTAPSYSKFMQIMYSALYAFSPQGRQSGKSYATCVYFIVNGL